MNHKMAVMLLAFFCGAGSGLRAGEPFTNELAILAVSREDQTNALKTRLLKKEVPLTEVLAALTTYNKVTRDQYLTYDHQLAGARGKVTLKDGKTYTWDLEPGYAAELTDAGGEKTYLLRPGLGPQPARGAARMKAGYTAYWLSKQAGAKDYGLLLLTRLPLNQLTQHLEAEETEAKLRPKGELPLFDRAALTIRTYEKDSIWNDDLRPLKPLAAFKDLDEKNRTVEVNGVRYQFEEGSLADVVRLLKTPKGKIPLHRIHAPLSGMEQTAKALQLLLEEQSNTPKKK